jgi:hypothetical protein
MLNHKFMLGAAVIIIIGLAASASGQIVYGQASSGYLRMIYSHWNQKDTYGSTSIDQVTAPLNGFVPLQENTELRFYAAGVSTSATIYDSDYKLSGLTDMRLQLNQSLSDDRFLLSLGLNLPTGKRGLSVADNRPVMELLTQNYMSFPIRRLGEGFGVNLTAGAGLSSGNLCYGGTVSYQINGSYEAYKNEGDYNPGDMFSASVSANIKKDKWGYVADATMMTSSTDKVDGQKVFKQSTEFDLHAGAAYNGELYIFNGDVGYLIRGRNIRYDSTEAVFDQLKIYGNEFYVSGRLAYSLDPSWYVAPLGELRMIAGNEYDFGSSHTIGLGAEIGRSIGNGTGIAAGFKYNTGSADGGNIDLSGVQLSLGLTAAF